MMRGKAAYLSRLYSRIPLKSAILSQHMEGLTPPSVFVGRHGYPKINLGPMMTAAGEDVSIMDSPEKWSHNTVSDILSFRIQLVRGKRLVNVRENNRFVKNMQEIALARHSVDIEAHFTKMPSGSFINEEIQPYGPAAPLKAMKMGNMRMEQHMEKAHFDTDMLSKDAVIGLYEDGLFISAIQKAFSTGAFGLEKNRKLVPTRWSITAVDDAIGKYLIEEIKGNPVLDCYYVYEYRSMNNYFAVLFMPTQWQYEFLEAFIKIFGNEEVLFSDSEGYNGRKDYAGMGGCYYSARLAAAEKLRDMKRQAGVVIFRESYTGYVPLGVWLVRQHAREALKSEPKKYSDINTALNYIYARLVLPHSRYMKQSKILRESRISISQYR